jgi:branched-chain amino acid transport system permease protein
MSLQPASARRDGLRAIPRDYLILIGLGLILPLVPLVTNQYQMILAILILYWAYLGSAWNIMGGYAGQFSFGHAAFFGLGAYTSTVLLVDFGVTPWIGMLVGAVIAGAFGVFMGFLTFRFGIKGHFFALATFAFAEMLRLIASDWKFIKASLGIHLPLVRGDDWMRMQFESTQSNFYYVMLGIFLTGTFLTIWIARSKLGYYLRAIREDEDAAAALVVDTLRYKIIAVAISGAMTAIGGSFFVQRFTFIDPALAFGVAISIDILLRPIVGGSGTIWGPLVGALLLTPLREVTSDFVRNPPPILSFIQGSAGVDVMLFGLLLIIVVIYMPDGIVGTLPRLLKRLQRRISGRGSPPAETPQEIAVELPDQEVKPS